MIMRFRRKDVLAIGALALAAAWVPNAQAATAEERAKCEEMVKKMGTQAPHDHGQEKTGAPNSMTTEHVRCKEILAEPAHGHKESPKHDQK